MKKFTKIVFRYNENFFWGYLKKYSWIVIFLSVIFSQNVFAINYTTLETQGSYMRWMTDIYTTWYVSYSWGISSTDKYMFLTGAYYYDTNNTEYSIWDNLVMDWNNWSNPPYFNTFFYNGAMYNKSGIFYRNFGIMPWDSVSSLGSYIDEDLLVKYYTDDSYYNETSWQSPFALKESINPSDVFSILNGDLIYKGTKKICLWKWWGWNIPQYFSIKVTDTITPCTDFFIGTDILKFQPQPSCTPSTIINGIIWSYPNCTVSCNSWYIYNGTSCQYNSAIINGLNCSTKKVQNLDGATWYNMGELPYNFNKSYTGVIWQQFTDVSSGSITDADNIRFTQINDFWSDIPAESIAWSGATTNSYLSGDGELQVRSVRDNQPLAFNIAQFGSIASGWNALGVRYQYMNGAYHEGISYLSGSTLTITTQQLSKWVFVSNLGRFKGIRLGVATEETKTFCGISTAACGWKMVGISNSCVPIQIQGIVLESGGCEITMSGSVYGSGACVPTVNSSGAIIPHISANTSTLYYDANGNLVGRVNTGNIPDVSYFDSVFNCGLDYTLDPWYAIVGKAITCPFTVAKNIFTTSYTSVKQVSEGLQKIENSVENLWFTTGATVDNWNSGMNPIFISLKEKTDFINNNDGSYVGKMVKFAYWSMIVMVVLLLLGIIIYLLKIKK